MTTRKDFFFQNPELCAPTLPQLVCGGRSSYDKAKLYIGKSDIAVIIAVDEEEENLEEKVEEKEDRRIGLIVMMSLRRKI